MTSPPAFYHALLRPVVLQTLRAAGYWACKPSVLDAFTDLAARYLQMLARQTAAHAANNGDSADALPTEVDVRMALQDVAALIPEKCLVEQEFAGQEDTRGMDEFLAWFSGPKNKQLKEHAAVVGDYEAKNYLSALKKKHSKTGEDSKYHGTILGRGNDQGDILIEGAEELTSIQNWVHFIANSSDEERTPLPAGSTEENGAATPSSVLSSLGDRLEDAEMDTS